MSNPVDYLAGKIASHLLRHLSSPDFTVSVLEYRVGDALFVKTSGVLSDWQHEHIMNVFRREFPDLKVFILENGLDVSIIRQTAGEK